MLNGTHAYWCAPVLHWASMQADSCACFVAPQLWFSLQTWLSFLGPALISRAFKLKQALDSRLHLPCRQWHRNQDSEAVSTDSGYIIRHVPAQPTIELTHASCALHSCSNEVWTCTQPPHLMATSAHGLILLPCCSQPAPCKPSTSPHTHALSSLHAPSSYPATCAGTPRSAPTSWAQLPTQTASLPVPTARTASPWP